MRARVPCVACTCLTHPASVFNSPCTLLLCIRTQKAAARQSTARQQATRSKTGAAADSPATVSPPPPPPPAQTRETMTKSRPKNGAKAAADTSIADPARQRQQLQAIGQSIGEALQKHSRPALQADASRGGWASLLGETAARRYEFGAKDAFRPLVGSIGQTNVMVWFSVHASPLRQQQSERGIEGGIGRGTKPSTIDTTTSAASVRMVDQIRKKSLLSKQLDHTGRKRSAPAAAIANATWVQPFLRRSVRRVKSRALEWQRQSNNDRGNHLQASTGMIPWQATWSQRVEVAQNLHLMSWPGANLSSFDTHEGEGSTGTGAIVNGSVDAPGLFSSTAGGKQQVVISASELAAQEDWMVKVTSVAKRQRQHHQLSDSELQPAVSPLRAAPPAFESFLSCPPPPPSNFLQNGAVSSSINIPKPPSHVFDTQASGEVPLTASQWFVNKRPDTDSVAVRVAASESPEAEASTADADTLPKLVPPPYAAEYGDLSALFPDLNDSTKQRKQSKKRGGDRHSLYDPDMVAALQEVRVAQFVASMWRR